MIDPEPVLKARLLWVQMYQQTQNQALTCRRCGISKKTLRKWCRRYAEQGEEGLRSQSRRPHKLRPRKVMPEHEALILDLRRTRRLGPKGLQRELLRLHQLRFSTRTIWKVLHKHGVSVLRPVKRPRRSKRYNRPIPSDRVQIDTCKIGKNLYQFTAIDDCTRMRVLALYSARSAPNAAHFVREHLLKELPFPIQRIQSDRGLEFKRPGVGVHRPGVPGRLARTAHQVPPEPTASASPQWQSGTLPTHRPHGVLGHSGSQGPTRTIGATVGYLAELLQRRADTLVPQQQNAQPALPRSPTVSPNTPASPIRLWPNASALCHQQPLPLGNARQPALMIPSKPYIKSGKLPLLLLTRSEQH